MNIFVLDEDPKECASYHCDQHVVKMVLETAQMLCTAAYYASGGSLRGPYKPTHRNHPCVKWAMESHINNAWLCELGVRLAEEYTHRYGKRHKSLDAILWAINNRPFLSQNGDAISFVQCVDDSCVREDGNAVEAYRKYYQFKNRNMRLRYTNRNRPSWLGPDWRDLDGEYE